MHAALIAFDQPMMINRLGTNRPAGMIYALATDVVPIDRSRPLGPGNVQLRPDKRPRPLVLRVNLHDCLKIDFSNFLTPVPASPQEPATRVSSVHVTGLELAAAITDDGFDAGANADGQVAPGGKRTYTLYAAEEGTFLMYSPAGDFNGFGQTQQMAGLFGAVTVEPAGAEWYRSQVSRADMMQAATTRPGGLPRINYEARFRDGPRRGQPVLRMTDGDEILASDLTALITGPRSDRFAPGSRPTANPTIRRPIVDPERWARLGDGPGVRLRHRRALEPHRNDDAAAQPGRAAARHRTDPPRRLLHHLADPVGPPIRGPRRSTRRHWNGASAHRFFPGSR